MDESCAVNNKHSFPISLKAMLPYITRAIGNNNCILVLFNYVNYVVLYFLKETIPNMFYTEI